MQRALDETNRRREIQTRYNEEHGIIPKSIVKKVHDVIRATLDVEDQQDDNLIVEPESMSKEELLKNIAALKDAMRKAAADLRFEEAAQLRDQIMEMKTALMELE